MASPQYHVFISHAGEDKHTVAIPLRDMLKRERINAFVDEKDIPPGGAATQEMTTAMDTVAVAVIVVSPEFPAKKWPMKELLFFLERRKQAASSGGESLVIIPVFYRLTVEDMYKEPRLGRKTTDGKSLYRKTRFLERMDSGEPEADEDIIRDALCTLHGFQGVENKNRASNDESSAPSRLLLLNEVSRMVSQAIPDHMKDPVTGDSSSSSDASAGFRRYFCHEPLGDVVLDFDSMDCSGVPRTYEGRIKHRILTCEDKSENVVAILGGGGVGKSTILKGLANDKDLRARFRDGVHLISLGTDASVEILFREVCQLLHDSGGLKTWNRLQAEKDKKTAIHYAIRSVISWFRGKSCAFLIDDVWTNKIKMELFVRLFRLGGKEQHNAVVFTTRELEIASVASLAGIFRISAREPQGAESRKILFFHAGVTENNPINTRTRDAIAETLDVCTGLPVGLAAAGKGIKMLAIDRGSYSEDVWNGYITRLRNHREQLIRENVRDYGNLYITLGSSLALLEGCKEEKLRFVMASSFAEQYRKLCVLQKQVRAPARMLKHLWKLRNDDEARDLGMRFVEVGLAESWYDEFRVGNEAWHLSIHDSLHDFAVAEATRHEDVIRAHETLLAEYSRFLPELRSEDEAYTMWWSDELTYDGYIHKYLPHHLEAAGREEEASFLKDLPEWEEQWRKNTFIRISITPIEN